MYERFFGLSEAPFRLTPDPRFLFPSPKHADALAHLRLGLEESSGFVCVTGDVGTGKTMILRTFLTSLGPDVSTAYVFNPALSPLELLQRINSEFGLPSRSTSKTRLTDALDKHLLAKHAAGRRSVVVIDEAQAVSIDTLEQLRLLSNLETTTEKLLRIVLVGQPQLRLLLQHPELVQLNQRITLRWHIGPLKLSETIAYIRHRVAVAVGGGGPARPLFSGPAMWRIHYIAGGVPRMINMVAHRAMLAAFSAGKPSVTLRSVLTAEREISAIPLPKRPYQTRQRAAAAAVGAGIAVGLGVLMARGWLPRLPESTVVATGNAPNPPIEASIAPTTNPVAPLAAASDPPTTVPVPAATPTTTPAPVVATPTPTPLPPAPASASDPTVIPRLASIDATQSLHDAFTSLFEAWQTAAFDQRDGQQPEHIAKVARRRNLEYLAFAANVAMLQMLDVPAVLELRIPDSSSIRYVAVVGFVDGKPLLQLDGAQRLGDPTLLTDHWAGQAHVVWRDFEKLGALDPSSKGAAVERLQGLLKRVGTFPGNPSGSYDPATSNAVREFQRTRFLEVDALVGKLTRLALYTAVGGYARPTLHQLTESKS